MKSKFIKELPFILVVSTLITFGFTGCPKFFTFTWTNVPPPTLSVLAPPLKAGEVVTISVANGESGETCRLDFDDGEDNPKNTGRKEAKYNEDGRVSFEITIPEWEQIVFSSDPARIRRLP